MDYVANLTSQSFWFLETKKTAELILEGFSREDILDKSLNENIFKVESVNSKKKIANFTFKRLNNFDSEGLEIFLDCDNTNAKIFVLISILCNDKLFFEFVYEVVRSKLILNELSIKKSDLNLFFKDKMLQSEKVDSWSESTISKLQSRYLEFLKAAGLIRIDKGDRFLQVHFIDFKLREYLEKNNFKTYVDCLTGEN